MFGGGVSLVSIVPVARVVLVLGHHLPIAGHLGDDGRGSDRRAAPIAVQHAALSDVEIGDAEGVDEHRVGQRRDREHGAPHRLERRPMDVQRVDLGGLDEGHRPRERARVIRSFRRSRSSAVSIFESASPGMWQSGSSTTAPATTGPARHPRPTSSHPAMR